MSFYTELMKELMVASKNNFSYKENYDEDRFGEVDHSPVTFRGRVRKGIEKFISGSGYHMVLKEDGQNENVAQRLNLLDGYLNDLEYFYDLLADKKSKELLLRILAFRILGFTKVKLPLNSPDYWKGKKKMDQITDNSDFINANFLNWKLPLVDLNKIGIPVQLYFTPMGAYIDFVVKQYEFNNGHKIIKAEKGDFVIDAGGCWGDTALYFGNEVGESGRVFTYEFIPSNIKIFIKNLSLNPLLEERVTLVKQPVWETSNETMYYIDNGPGSSVSMKEPEKFDGKVSSLSIDDLVVKYNIKKVDFIKMDIEGAEPYALNGALETIKRHKPKLAIAIYHSMNDFVKIPKFIDDLGLGYKMHLAHCSIHEEETILFAEI